MDKQDALAEVTEDFKHKVWNEWNDTERPRIDGASNIEEYLKMAKEDWEVYLADRMDDATNSGPGFEGELVRYL